MQFIIHNWYLFAALAVILFLIVAGPISLRLHGVKNANVAQTIQLINRQDGVVVDVREPNEFKNGRIPNAINLPLSSLKSRAGDLVRHKDKPLVVACHSGQRSVKGAVILRQHGFPAVYTLAGGLLAWERDNLPVE